MIYYVSNAPLLFSKLTRISEQESLDMLEKCDVLQFDSETSGRDARICDLLCIQFGSDKYDFQIVVDTSTIDVNIYKNVLESKLLVLQNAKFDLQFLYNYKIIPRRVWDTMIVEQLLYLGYPYVSISPNKYEEFNHTFPYLINEDEKSKARGNYELSFSLKAIAMKYLGIDIDKTVRGEIMWRGLDESVALYAAGDVMYLEKIMKSQIKACKEKGCMEGAKLECLFVPVIAYLEWCGIKLDVDKWKAKMKKDRENLDSSTAALNNFVINMARNAGVLDGKLAPEFQSDPFFHTKFKELSKCIVYNRQGDLFTGFDTEPKCSINWDSPRQVIAFAKLLGFNTVTQDKETGEDKDSVLEKHLKSQKGINDTFLDLYFTYKEHSKVCSTYGESQLNMVNPKTGRCHTQYKQLGAASGRMSCGSKQSNTDLAKLKGLTPSSCVYCNFQQLPANEETRSCFVSEPGNYFCSSDFSALESRLGADIYQEQSMIEEFLYKSGDIHSLVAKACFPELKDKTTEEIKKDYPHLRKKAKPIGFSQQFGGSARAIAQSLGCPLEEAEAIAKSYLDGFPGIAQFKSEGSKAVRQNGYVLMCKYTGHKMYWWDHEEWKSRQQSFTKEFWEDYKLNHKNTSSLVAKKVREHFQASSKWDRMALNAPTQNTGICILKSAMTEFFNWIVDNDLFEKVKIVALVHDEANIEYPASLPETCNILKSCMENAASRFCKSLPIPAENAVGTHWIH